MPAGCWGVTVAQSNSGLAPGLDPYLERESALELARRSLVGAPVYAVVSLIILFGTPILQDYGAWAAMQAALLVLLGIVRCGFARTFERRYDAIGERAVVQFSILTAMQSLPLGVMAAMVIWQYWATREAALTAVLAVGCIAAGTSALSVRRSAHFIFLLCVLTPLCIAVFLVGGLTKALLIAGFLMLMALLVQDGGQARRLYLDHLRARFEAQASERRAAIEREARKEFFRDIDHEIRTPVTSILGMTTLLEWDDPKAESREYLEIIRRSAESLVALVDDIPGAVRSRQDIRTPEPGPIDPAQLLRDVLSLYAVQARGNGVELVTHFDNLPVAVRLADTGYLEQVMANLLDNAVRHTRGGTVTVAAYCRGRDATNIELIIEVADTGEGIAQARLGSLFDTRDSSGVRVSGKHGGHGLGLPVCGGLVKLLGGAIHVDSVEGEGTRVTVELPGELDAPAADWQPTPDILAAGHPQLVGDLSAAHPHRILVVEGHARNRRVLCQYLAGLGYRADESEDGKSAVAAAMNGDYDLIFMDIRMPEMNGIEATRWIREHAPAGRKIRIAALTDDASGEMREECLAAGMDDFIPKPIRPEALEAVLRGGTPRQARSDEEAGDFKEHHHIHAA